MSKTIQIPMETFIELCKVHLAGVADETMLNNIQDALEKKLDAVLRRESYSRYKDITLTEAEREQARQEYLDRVGIPLDFRR